MLENVFHTFSTSSIHGVVSRSWGVNLNTPTLSTLATEESIALILFVGFHIPALGPHIFLVVLCSVPRTPFQTRFYLLHPWSRVVDPGKYRLRLRDDWFYNQ